MKLTDSTLLEMLLSTSDIMTLRQVLNDLLSGPAAIEELGLRLREAPLHIWDKSIVSTRGSQLVGVLKVIGLVGSTWVKQSVRIWKRQYSRGLKWVTMGLMVTYPAEEHPCHYR